MALIPLRHELELLRSPSRQLAVSVCVAKPSPVQAYRVGVLARACRLMASAGGAG